MSRTDRGEERWPPGTLAAALAVLLTAAASAFWLFAPTGTTETSGASLERPAGASGVSGTERRTEDGSYIVRETVTYPSGRTKVREYTRRANVKRTTLLEEQPEAIVPVVAIAIALAGFPLVLNGTALRRQARALAATLLLVGSLLAGFSVGFFYLPSAAAMAVAAARG